MEKVRIQDDLYTYVNQKKLEELVIPDDQPATGGFNILAKDVEKIMIGQRILNHTKFFKHLCHNSIMYNLYGSYCFYNGYSTHRRTTSVYEFERRLFDW